MVPRFFLVTIGIVKGLYWGYRGIMDKKLEPIITGYISRLLGNVSTFAWCSFFILTEILRHSMNRILYGRSKFYICITVFLISGACFIFGIR